MKYFAENSILTRSKASMINAKRAVEKMENGSSDALAENDPTEASVRRVVSKGGRRANGLAGRVFASENAYLAWLELHGNRSFECIEGTGKDGKVTVSDVNRYT